MKSKGYAAVMELQDGTQFINLQTISETREGVREAVKEVLESWYIGPTMRFVEIIPVVITASDVIEIPK